MIRSKDTCERQAMARSQLGVLGGFSSHLDPLGLIQALLPPDLQQVHLLWWGQALTISFPCWCVTSGTFVKCHMRRKCWKLLRGIRLSQHGGKTGNSEWDGVSLRLKSLSSVSLCVASGNFILLSKKPGFLIYQLGCCYLLTELLRLSWKRSLGWE